MTPQTASYPPKRVLNIMQDMKSMALLAALLNESYALSLTLAICRASKVRPAPPPGDDDGGDDELIL